MPEVRLEDAFSSAKPEDKQPMLGHTGLSGGDR
jgi:hypothetical protein